MSSREGEPASVPSDPDAFADLDDDLVALAPVTPWQAVSNGVAFGALGIVGLALLAWAFVARGLSFDGWILVAVATMLVALGVVVVRTGRRAYRTLTDASVRAHYRTALVGLWIVASAAIAGGIAGANPALVIMAVAVAQVPIRLYEVRTVEGGETDRILRLLRPWMIVQWIVALLGPLAIVAALAWTGAPHDVERPYERLAASVPVLAGGGLVGFLLILWRSRRRPRSS